MFREGLLKEAIFEQQSKLQKKKKKSNPCMQTFGIHDPTSENGMA